MPRRRPLIWEEKQQRKTRQVATGNGQANARPVKLFPSKVQKPGGLKELFVETYDIDVAMARGYVNATFDPAGDFEPPP